MDIYARIQKRIELLIHDYERLKDDGGALEERIEEIRNEIKSLPEHPRKAYIDIWWNNYLVPGLEKQGYSFRDKSI